MAADAAAREVPSCTIFLVVGALCSHVLVLTGNLSTSQLLHDLGHSSHGWASIGGGISDALHQELDPAMANVSSFLSQSLGLMTKVETGVDLVLSSSGATADAALDHFDATKQNATVFKQQFIASLEVYAAVLFDNLQVVIDAFAALIEPALRQIQEWMMSFGEKIQAALEEFGSTLDKVQKLFDEVMSKISPNAGLNEDDMISNTYSLIDTDNSGVVTADDLRSLSTLYGIPALSGHKADKLFEKYDANGQGGLGKDEYGLLVHDPSVPGLMTLTLRTYARRLSAVGGKVAAARMRDEVARTVVKYLSLVCAKNMTKVGWVADALTNGSLPLEFTADLLKDLAMDVDNPNKLTLLDVGATVVGEMMRLQPGRVVEALRLMADPEFWASEGFDPTEQPLVLERAVRWASQAGGPGSLHALGLGAERLPEAALGAATAAQARHLATEGAHRARRDSELYRSKASRRLRDLLLAGVGALAAGDAPEADAAQRRGAPAVPATLQFAAWLAANATQAADGFLADCFDYSGESSGALESFASSVNGMIKRVQGFVTLMSRYASPRGIERLLADSRNFSRGALQDVLVVAEAYASERLHLCTGAGCQPETPLVLSGAFSFLTGPLRELKAALPAVVESLKHAREEVSAVATGMASVMAVLKDGAPPLFYQVSHAYRALWVAYFVLFSLITLGVLFYGFWAAGCGGLRAAPRPGPAAGLLRGLRRVRARLRGLAPGLLVSAARRGARRAHDLPRRRLRLRPRGPRGVHVRRLLAGLRSGRQHHLHGCPEDAEALPEDVLAGGCGRGRPAGHRRRLPRRDAADVQVGGRAAGVCGENVDRRRAGRIHALLPVGG